MAKISGTTSNDIISSAGLTYLNGKKPVTDTSKKTTSGIDEVQGGNGDDTVYAGDGNDLIAGGNGSDILYGENGDDTIWGDTLGTPDSNENGQDQLYGGAGNDTMYGGNGKDYLDGGADNDFLYGNNGTDILLGDAGNDKLTGGLGGDVLSGGIGADTFIYTTNTASAVSDSPYTAGAAGSVTGSGANTGWNKSWDIIRDFSGAAGDGDKIDLSQLAATAGQPLVWRTVATSDANAGTPNPGFAYGVWVDTAGNFLYADITGDGAADMKIQVSGVGLGDLTGVIADTTGPSVTISFENNDTLINDADNANGTIVTFQFSEPVSSFNTASVTTSAGTLTGWTQVDADTWTAILTVPTNGDGNATITVPAGSYVDFSSNLGSIGSAGIAYDTSNPTVVSVALIDEVDGSMAPVTSDDLLNVTDGTATLRIVFSEAVANFTAADLGLTNGTVTGLTSSDNITWYATFTADAGVEGTGSVSVTAGGYTDTNGNTGGAGGPATIAIDNVAPTVTIEFDDTLVSDPDEPGGTVVTFTFSGDVDAAAVDTSQITASVGAFSNWQAVGNVLTATYNAPDNFDGDATISVASAAYIDDAGNAGTANSADLAIDTVNPTLVSIVFEDSSLDDADDQSQVTIKFSEAVSNPNTSLSATNGTLGTFTSADGGVTWTGTFTASQDTEASGSVTVADGYTDLAGNSGTGGDGGASIVIDTKNPTVTVTFEGGDTLINDSDNADGTLVTFQFSETLGSFDTSQVTTSAGSFSGWTQVDGDTWTALLTVPANGDGTATIGVPGASFSDVTGNVGTTGGSAIDYDTSNPTVTIDIVDAALNDTDGVSDVTITFSEEVSGFVEGDLNVTGGTLSGFATSDNITWTATFTATDGYDSDIDGVAGISLAGTDYTDVIGNIGTNGSDTVDVDTLNPTLVSIVFEDSSLDDADDTSNVTITFSEAVDDINAYLTGTNGTPGTFTSADGIIWTGTFQADQNVEGNGSITVENGYIDLVGNTGTGGDGGASIVIDTRNPTVTIDIVDESLSDTDSSSNVTITFSEDVSGFEEADLGVTGGTLSGFTQVNGSQWTAIFTATDGFDGEGSVTLAGADYTDITGNNGADGDDTVDIDRLNPTVTIDIVDSALNDADPSSNVTITFNEAVSGFVEGDLVVTGGSLSSFLQVDATHWTATFTATNGYDSNDGTLPDGAGISLAGSAYTDLVGNAGTAGGDTVDVDTLNPTVTIDIVDTALNDTDNSSNVTITFSEEVSGFVEGDLVVTGGALSNFLYAGGNQWTATFTATDGYDSNDGTLPDGAGISLGGSAYTDVTGNAGTTGGDTVVIDTLNPTLVSVVFADSSLDDDDLVSNVTITFSEAVNNPNASLSGTNGTLGTFTSADGGISWTGTFTANQNTEATGSITVANGYTDLAGNSGTGGTGGGSIAIDTRNPVVSSITFANTLLTDGTPSTTVTVVFSEAVSGFDNSDVTPTGGTLSTFTSLDNITWTATFTATDGYDSNDATLPDGAGITIGNTFTDATGNSGTGSSQSVEIDRLNPTVTSMVISPTTLTDGVPTATVTVTFSEAIDPATLTAADFSAARGTFGGAVTHVSGNTYSIQYTATDGYDGGDTITLGNIWTDANGNGGTGSTVGVTIDRAEGPPPATPVDSVTFIPSLTNIAHNGGSVAGVLGILVAYDADGNVIPNAFTPTVDGSITIAADGTLSIVGAVNNYEDTITLFGGTAAETDIHIRTGNGSGNEFVYTGSNAIEILIGFDGNDTLTGGNQNDSLYGGNNGNTGGDTLAGGPGNDFLFGGAGPDALSGGGGDDLLLGGSGADNLAGGAGSDRFVYLSGTDSTLAARDVITDFVDADDTIDLDALNLTSISNTSLSANGAYWYQSGGNTYLDADTNGDGIADFSIMILGVHSLDATASGNVIL